MQSFKNQLPAKVWKEAGSKKFLASQMEAVFEVDLKSAAIHPRDVLERLNQCILVKGSAATDWIEWYFDYVEAAKSKGKVFHGLAEGLAVPFTRKVMDHRELHDGEEWGPYLSSIIHECMNHDNIEVLHEILVPYSKLTEKIVEDLQFYSSYARSAKMICYLVKQWGMDLSRAFGDDRFYKRMPLYGAEHLEAFQALVELGADINEIDRYWDQKDNYFGKSTDTAFHGIFLYTHEDYMWPIADLVAEAIKVGAIVDERAIELASARVNLFVEEAHTGVRGRFERDIEESITLLKDARKTLAILTEELAWKRRRHLLSTIKDRR